MLFNSIDFAVFLPIVFALYWSLGSKHIRWQNIFLVIASYLFYGWWDWRFLTLIAFSTSVDFLIGLQLVKQKAPRSRKFLLGVSIVLNLGLLGFFKYFNFFIENFNQAFTLLGSTFQLQSLKIILPIGISFYTFQTLSYTIDVYRGKLKPTLDFVNFAAFVSFFPQLVAGPIERATNLLPQFFEKRIFSFFKAKDGLRQIIWGLLKKIVIADNCAIYANTIFENSEYYNGSTLLLGAVFFAFQIYGDFSGYSDIAIGTARLFGFNLRQNFAFPYFSRDIAEFWRRWHISLSTWFRDYLYIPLGGSRGSRNQQIRNVFIIFLVSGFWHGANWTFIAWGGLNAIYFLPLMLTNRNRQNLESIEHRGFLNILKVGTQIGLTFFLTVIAWIFFRAESIREAFIYLNGVFSRSLFELPDVHPPYLIGLLVVFLWIEWSGKTEQYAIQHFLLQKSKWIRWSFYYLIILSLYLFGVKEQEFIYFQF